MCKYTDNIFHKNEQKKDLALAKSFFVMFSSKAYLPEFFFSVTSVRIS